MRVHEIIHELRKQHPPSAVPSKTWLYELRRTIQHPHVAKSSPKGDGRGRKRVIKPSQKRTLERLLRYNHRPGRAYTCRRLAAELGVTCSVPTVWRAIKTIPGAKARRPRKAILLNERQKRRRRQFARLALKQDIAKFWLQTTYVDEKKFKTSGPDSLPRVFTMGKKRVTRTTPEHSSSGVMVWMGLGPDGIIGPHRCNGTLTGPAYLAILQKYLGDMSPYLFQDRAAAHKAKANLQWLAEQGVTEVQDDLCTAPKLVELNIIENMWGIFQARLYKNNPPFRTPDQLYRDIEKLAREMNETGEARQRYVAMASSIHRRARAVLAAGGGEASK